MSSGMLQPLVTIIVPIYKVEAYLKSCIDSILAQTYRNIEIILVDDGSPDACPQICDEYANLDSRVRVVHKTNGGLSDARNAGLDIAKGNYIAFVDSDDVVHSRFIECLLQQQLAHDADVVFCAYTVFEEDRHLNFQDSYVNSVTVLNGMEMLGTLYNKSWVPKNVVAWNKLYKKELFALLRYPVGRIHEDEFVFVPLFGQPLKVVYWDQELIAYRRRQGSITENRLSLDKLLCQIEYNKLRTDFFKQNGMQQMLQQHRSNENKTYLQFFLAERFTMARDLLLSRRFWEILSAVNISFRAKLAFIKAILTSFLSNRGHR